MIRCAKFLYTPKKAQMYYELVKGAIRGNQCFHCLSRPELLYMH